MPRYTSMDDTIYFTRLNKEKEASEDEIKSFEKSAISDFSKGKEVYIIEKFPKKFFYFATKIKIEKVVDPVPSLSTLSNSRLFKVVSTGSIYE
jgi:hypothetical protein